MLNVVQEGLLQRLRVRAGRRWARWINRRIPPSKTVTLDQKRIFIFPSRPGLYFLLSLLVMTVFYVFLLLYRLRIEERAGALAERLAER